LAAAASAGGTVLAPHTEMSTALLHALERTYLAAGREVWPTPQVRDFRGWLRELHAQQQLACGGLPRCLSDFEERELWRDIVAADDSRPEALDPGIAARLAQRARRSVIEYAIPWRAVSAQGSAETEIFLEWNRQFEERCRSLNCFTVDDVPGRIEPPGNAITWLDTPSWRPAARTWLTRCGRALTPSPVAHSAVFKMHAGSPDAELAAAADWARRRLASNQDFRAWICVPDLAARRAEVTDAFDAALALHRYGFAGDASIAPYAVAGGTPLADYAPVRIALEVLETDAAAIPFTRFSALLRSPYLQDADEAESDAALLDMLMRERAPSEAAMADWLDLAEATTRSAALKPAGAVQSLRAIHAALTAVRGTRRFSDWLPVWLAALSLGPWRQPANWSSFEYQAVERFRELLASLASADAFFGSHSRESAQRMLRRAARETSFQPQTGVPPIWVSSQVADPWLNYDGLWVSGMSAESWPAPVETLALLPVRVQREYGVTTASFEAQLRLASQLQERWLQRAGECIFSFADSADGRSSAPSPLLPAGASILDAAGDAEQPRPHWRTQHAAAPPLERFLDELAPGFGAADRTRGVASLRAQSLCPFRGFAETRLRADGLEQPTPGFNERERGQLVHLALEHVWSVLRDSRSLQALPPEAQRELLDAGAERALRTVCARRDPGPTWRRRERSRLGNLLGKWLDVERQRQPFAVEWMERRERLRSAGLDFDLRIDRADRLLEDGARILIDYKTGSAHPDWRGERPDNPQLPVYALLSAQSLIAVAYGNVNAAEPCFVYESERADTFRPGARVTSLEGAGDLAALLEIWSVRVEALAAGLAHGQAQVAPTASACRYCRLQGLCRVPSALDDEEPA
jgi:ATP-dependent helicase/nuclease subunit B